MTPDVNVNPEVLRWARKRAAMETATLASRFPRYREWENGTAQPTLKQLERLARTLHASVGYFFLPEPPEEELPIPDFRTVGNKRSGRPSVSLLDTVYLCQQRQDWYRTFARMEGEDPVPFVGSATPDSSVRSTAEEMRTVLRFDLEERRSAATWTDALRRFIEQADAVGVLVMVNGVVGNNTYRKLDPDEFRGFALADDLAPLVFINGADTKAAQMFTLAHEMAHLWLGESALSDLEATSEPSHAVEAWCNRVAAELLVPMELLRLEYRPSPNLTDELNRLARRIKVSTLVILRRVFDAGELGRDAFISAYRRELDRLRRIPRTGGGTFHPTLKTRVGHRFGVAVTISTLGGRTSFSESFRLLGIRKASTLRGFAASLQVSL
ncbi:MAG: XRE family transcriptional regulator [Acidobacteria bacterium]|nr:XRE family transcriptional regulator [Acidobacteriota bacterium]